MMDTLAIDDRILGVFLEEALRCLADMRTGLGALRAGDAAAAEALWRGAHTIKGNAAMLDMEALAELAGAVERFGAATALDVAQTGADWIDDMITRIDDGVRALAGADAPTGR